MVLIITQKKVDQAQLFNCQINGESAPGDKHGNDKEDTNPFLSKEVLSRQGNQPGY